MANCFFEIRLKTCVRYRQKCITGTAHKMDNSLCNLNVFIYLI